MTAARQLILDHISVRSPSQSSSGERLRPVHVFQVNKKHRAGYHVPRQARLNGGACGSVDEIR